MRINVYAEELTTETELVTKQVVPAGGTEPVTFYAIRLYLKSPDALHHTTTDDDRSAITIWVPWTYIGGNNFRLVSDLLHGLRDSLREGLQLDRPELFPVDHDGHVSETGDAVDV